MTKRHENYEVDILDIHGKLIAIKPRKDIDREKDILHLVYVFVITPEGKLLLSRIPKVTSKHPLFANKLGVTVATIVRHNEAHLKAAKRAMRRELGVNKPDLTFLGETLESFPGIPKRLIAAYMCTASQEELRPKSELTGEIVPVSGKDLEALMRKRKELAPTLLVFWDRYADSMDDL